MTTHFDLWQHEIIAELARDTGFSWRASIGQFVNNALGALVPESLIRRRVEVYNDKVTAPTIDNATERLIDGRLPLAEWQDRMAIALREGYINNVQLGRGGRGQTTFRDWGRQGGRLRFEYRQLNTFAQAIKNGTLTPAQIIARAKLYAAGVRTAYFDGLTAAKNDAGFTEEQRFLGKADHCSVCVGFAAQGRVPIGTLPEPGTECEGMHNCKCFKKYFKPPLVERIKQGIRDIIGRLPFGT